MGNKKLISPEFRVTVGDYEISEGIEVECFSSKESHMDWCRVELSPQLQGLIQFKDMDEATVELGYEDDFDSLIDGYVRCGDGDYWKEIMIKDDMMKLGPSRHPLWIVSRRMSSGMYWHVQGLKTISCLMRIMERKTCLS